MTCHLSFIFIYLFWGGFPIIWIRIRLDPGIYLFILFLSSRGKSGRPYRTSLHKATPKGEPLDNSKCGQVYTRRPPEFSSGQQLVRTSLHKATPRGQPVDNSKCGQVWFRRHWRTGRVINSLYPATARNVFGCILLFFWLCEAGWPYRTRQHTATPRGNLWTTASAAKSEKLSLEYRESCHLSVYHNYWNLFIFISFGGGSFISITGIVIPG